MKIVWVFTQDIDMPSGGAKQAYRHIDILNANGFDACIAHATKGFRYTWFENNTKVVCADDVFIGPDDFLIYGELVDSVPRINGWDRCGHVVAAQNPFNIFHGFNGDLGRIKTIYDSAAGILCPSEYATEKTKFFFPSARVFHFQYSFDREPFKFSENKQKVLAYMPRKLGGVFSSTFSGLALRRMAQGWRIKPIAKNKESVVARELSEASVFVSLSEKEGFGMPPAEAMASGCVVVGFPGYAGKEFMLPNHCFPVDDMDTLSLSEGIEKVMLMSDESRLDIGQKASSFIRTKYSSEKEEKSILSAWNSITDSRTYLHESIKSRVRKEVVAYIQVYNEKDYFEPLLKWIAGIVAEVRVYESSVTWSGEGEEGGKTKEVIDKVIAENPDLNDRIKYMLLPKGTPGITPAQREIEQRNTAMSDIRAAGYDWAWHIDADEFYANSDVEKLWKWFFERADFDDNIMGARTHWYTYWRSLHWRVDPKEPYCPNIILRTNATYVQPRILSDDQERRIIDVPESVCVVRHYSWARTPSDAKKKIATWGHADEIVKGWFENKFMTWKPGIDMVNLHPVIPSAYRGIVRCSLPAPEALTGHKFFGKEIIMDDNGTQEELVVQPRGEASLKIKVVIMTHNRPLRADSLYKDLKKVFDDVELFDNGSSPENIPMCVTHVRPNVYWTGTWNEVLEKYSDYDVVWVVGSDIQPISSVEEIKKSIEDSYPFGCWSPAIEGRAHPFMQQDNYKGQSKTVKNIEGMALAVSGPLMKIIKRLPVGSPIGFGHDFWMCYMSRKNGFKNIIDGRVRVWHPPEIGYNEEIASVQMETAYSKLYGKDYRKTIFEYDPTYEGNLFEYSKENVLKKTEKKLTIVTVDNGWGLGDFVNIVSKIPDTRRIVLMKGPIQEAMPGIEVITFSEEALSRLMEEADVALFTKVGHVNKDEYKKILEAGIPVVVHKKYDEGLIIHETNGFHYLDNSWAVQWLQFLKGAGERERIRSFWASKETIIEDVVMEVPETESVFLPKEVDPVVTVITPTFKREPSVISRSVCCMLLQTMSAWEQIVCSDGAYESHVDNLVKKFRDPRLFYFNTEGKKEGDFGNTVRLEMLKKARGKYVLFLDDDNIIMPEYLNKMVKKLDEAPDCGFAVCSVMHFGPLNEEEIGPPPIILKGEPVKLYHIDPLQVLVRRDIMQEIGWDTGVGYLSDGVTLEKLGNKYKHVRVEEVLGVHI